MERRTNAHVLLTTNVLNFQAKHNSAMQALPMLNRIPDAASATKVQVVVPMTKANQGLHTAQILVLTLLVENALFYTDL